MESPLAARRGSSTGRWRALAVPALVALIAGTAGGAAAGPLSERTPALIFTGETASLPLEDTPLTLPNGRLVSAAAMFGAAAGAPLEPTGLYVYDLIQGRVTRFESTGALSASMLNEKPAVFGVCVRAPAANARFIAAPAGQTLAAIVSTPGTLALLDPAFPCDSGITMVADGPPPPPADTTPPVLTLPADFTVTTTSAAGTVATWAASALDAKDGPVPVTCTPPSGSLFPRGITPVNCSASDAAGNLASGSFRVTVVCSLKGDLDGDCDVDRNDLSILMVGVGKPASGPGDPRDLDGDGRITTLDGRKLVLLCTRPQCATQ